LLNKAGCQISNPLLFVVLKSKLVCLLENRLVSLLEKQVVFAAQTSCFGWTNSLTLLHNQVVFSAKIFTIPFIGF
jgi:hypothetical protein